MSTGGNKINKKSKSFEVYSYIAALSPLYLSFIIGKSYFSGFIVGAMCSWGVNNIYNVIPDKYDLDVINYNWQKKRKVRKLIATLRNVEKKKREKI
mgnify:CR=1 FL=1